MTLKRCQLLNIVPYLRVDFRIFTAKWQQYFNRIYSGEQFIFCVR